MPFIEEIDLEADSTVEALPLVDEALAPKTGRIIEESALVSEGPELRIAPPRRLWDEVKGKFRDAGEDSAKATQALVDGEMFGIAPSTALRLQDTINDTIAKDPKMTEMRSIISKAAQEEDNVATTTRAADLARSLPAGALSAVGNSIRGLGELNEALATYTARGLELVLPESAMEFITKPIIPWYLNPTGILREPGITISKVSERVRVPEERRTLAVDITEGVGQMGGQLASLLVNPTAGTVMLFGLGADIQAQEAERAGATEEEKAAAVVTGAAITGLSERTGLDLILNRVPPNIKSATLRYLTDIAIGGGIEAAEEVVEGILHNLTSYAIYDPEAKIFEGLEKEAITAGGAGAIVRGLVGVLTGAKTRRPGVAPEAVEAKAEPTISATPEAIAEDLDIIYNGVQETPVSMPDLFMFTDKQTGSTMAVPSLDDVETRLNEMRAEFEKREPAILEAEIVPEVTPEEAAIVEAQTDAALDMIIEGADFATLTDEDIEARITEAPAVTEEVDPIEGAEIEGELPAEVRVRAERLISDEAYQAAQARIKEKLKGLKAGVDPTIIPDMIITGAYHIETGLKTFGKWSKQMVDEFGDKIKPILRGIWEQSNSYTQGQELTEEMMTGVKEALLPEADVAVKPAKGIKAQVARAAGLKQTSRMIREDKALSAAWKKAEQNARIAFREGNKKGVIEERARMKEIFDNARARVEATTQIGKLKNSILKELKTTKVKKQAGKPVGKFTADVQRVLDTFREAAKMTEEQAQDKIVANIEKYEGKNIPSTVSIENRILDMIVRLKTKNDKGGSAPLRTRFTAKELQTLLHEIKTLKKTGRMVSELARLDKSARHKANVETAIDVITGQEGLPKGIETVGIEEIKPSPKEFKKWLEKFTSNVGVHFVGWGDLMDMLSVRDKTSKPGESALNKLTEVHTQENARKAGERAAHQEIIDMANEVFGFKSEGDLMRQFNLDAKEIEIGDFVNANGAKVSLKMTRAEARKFMLEYSDPTLKETFHLGMGFTDEMVRAVSDVLTPKDVEFVGRQLAFYRTYYDRVNEVYRDIYGVDLPFNEFYSPIRREGLKGTDGLFSDFLDEVSYRQSVTSGSHKTRVKNLHRISKRSDVAVLEQHIAEMEHFIAWADKIRDLNAIFKDPQVRAAIKLHHTPSMLAVIDKYINDFTRGGIESASRLGWLDKFRGNFTRSVLAVKGNITIKQLTSTAAYAEVMPVKDFVVGMADFWKNPVKNFQWLKANSEWFAARGLGNMERDIKTAMKMKEYSAYRKGRGFLDSLMLNVAIGDQGAIAIGMWAQIKHLKKKGIPQSEAIITAEKFSEVTQQSSDLSIQSHFQRAGSIAKIATMFMSAPNLYFRKEMGAMRNLLAGRGSKASHMKTIAIYHLVIPMIFQLVADGFEWDKDNQKRAMILGAFNGIFLISDMLEFVVSKALGIRAFPMEAAILSPAKDLAAFLTEAIEWLAEGNMTDEEFYRAARGLGGAMGSVTGVPMKQAVDQLRTASNLMDGEFEKALKGAFGYSPYLIERQSEKKGKLKF